MSFAREHKSLLWKIAAVWLLFVATEVGKGVYSNALNTPFLRYCLLGLYLYFPWFLISIGCGIATKSTLDKPLLGPETLRIHLPFAFTAVALHLLMLTSAYWLFWPERVVNVSFAFVFGEQTVKWLHFEVIAYLLLVYIWRRRLLNGELNSPKQQANTGPHQLALDTDRGLIKLDCEQVDWLLADDNYVIVHTRGRELRVRSTLKDMMSQLHGEQFQQTHRSAIVNMNRVAEIGSQRLVLDTGTRVPVSRRKHRKLVEAFNR